MRGLWCVDGINNENGSLLTPTPLISKPQTSGNATQTWGERFGNLFSYSKDWDVDVKTVNEQKFLIVDNAINTSSNLLNFGETLDYDLLQSVSDLNVFPGERALVCFYPFMFLQKIIKTYEQFGSNLIRHGARFRREPIIFTRISPNRIHHLTRKQRLPHIDAGRTLIAVLHLTHKKADAGATGFYRHKASGLSYMPHCPTQEIAELMRDKGLNPFDSSYYHHFR